MIVNVKGNIGYSEYEDNVSVKKEITSIVLSKVEDEADFKATFTQTILLDSNSIGKKDEEKKYKNMTLEKLREMKLISNTNGNIELSRSEVYVSL